MNQTVYTLAGIGAVVVGAGWAALIVASATGIYRALQRFNRWAWPLPTDTIPTAPVSAELTAALALLAEHDRQLDESRQPSV